MAPDPTLRRDQLLEVERQHLERIEFAFAALEQEVLRVQDTGGRRVALDELATAKMWAVRAFFIGAEKARELRRVTVLCGKCRLRVDGLESAFATSGFYRNHMGHDVICDACAGADAEGA